MSEAVAAHHRERLGWDVDAGAVSLLPDVLSALHSVIAHHTRPGSPVIVPTPAYMPFLSIPALHGRQCLQVPALRAAGAHGRPRWTLDLEAIGAAMADGAGLLVLCHPWNPVGRVLEAAAAIFVPFIIIVAGLLVRMRVKDAVSAGITLGIAFSGMTMLISYMTAAITLAAQAMSETVGVDLPITDGG